MTNAPTPRETADHAELARVQAYVAHAKEIKQGAILVSTGDLEALLSEIAALRGGRDRLRIAASKSNEEVCQSLGKALGYPWFKDDQANFPGSTEEHGVCVGDHVAESIADEAARRLSQAERQRDEALDAARKLSAAISWTDYPFIGDNTSREEMISRLGFMQKDAEQPRAAIANQGADQ